MANLIPLAIADLELQLGSSITAGDESFTISSAVDDDGTALPAGKYCFTVDSGTSNKEYLIGQLNGVNVTSVKSVSRQGVETTGAARAHRVGNPCIVTNFATIQRVADILRGVLTLDGTAPIVYDAEPTLSNREELATVGYVLDTVTGGTVSFDTQTTAGNAGETVAAGNLVYFKTSDQEWYLADALVAAEVENVAMGFALGAGTDGAGISGGIQISGTFTTTGLTAGSTYYATDTAGSIGTTAGTTNRVVGVALSSTKLLMTPVTPDSLTSNEKAALAGTSGVPSATNRFVTEENNAQIVEFTSSGTWTKDTGLKRIRVQAWGGGASGAAGSSSDSSEYFGGGGGGQYVEAVFVVDDLSSTETVTVGSGGAAVTSTGGVKSAGLAGGSTTFGSLLTALGGAAGADEDIGGDGGYSSLGEGQGGRYYIPTGSASNSLVLAGQKSVTAGAGGSAACASDPTTNPGGDSVYGGGGGGAARGAFSQYSNGGTSQFGGNGGNGSSATLDTTAASGSVPGGGGGGAHSEPANTSTSGAGGDGKVIVTEYYI